MTADRLSRFSLLDGLVGALAGQIQSGELAPVPNCRVRRRSASDGESAAGGPGSARAAS